MYLCNYVAMYLYIEISVYLGLYHCLYPYVYHYLQFTCVYDTETAIFARGFVCFLFDMCVYTYIHTFLFISIPMFMCVLTFVFIIDLLVTIVCFFVCLFVCLFVVGSTCQLASC